ncbi:tautomerase [Aliarcobacter cryaerophilus ATCC 43158]|uniref:Tautomerase n=1 Tax=Aliarcobacter cryaerophilus ATCC 43158 TaxID=1032070 RepID=A0AAD0TVA7_9BACT|nr:4-oxalocrotonate tautomerase family protein [Aliarcobacter cryaerophilus]AYJ80194.1 4-oxalocrotonate tautomerase family enzyme [Aliarcobacter cryaerophilus ATCC 43158]PRM97831.1 tautomerase [Aliarcobacter cryaerophilus]QCZ24413.1 tautomerase [Aliarcobacter cryaerophilus ATCC 43158]
MPVINVKMTHEDGGATIDQKNELAKGITELFSKIFNRSSSNAVVLIEEFNTDNYYIGGKSVTKIRKEK